MKPNRSSWLGYRLSPNRSSIVAIYTVQKSRFWTHQMHSTLPMHWLETQDVLAPDMRFWMAFATPTTSHLRYVRCNLASRQQTRTEKTHRAMWVRCIGVSDPVTGWGLNRFHPSGNSFLERWSKMCVVFGIIWYEDGVCFKIRGPQSISSF